MQTQRSDVPGSMESSQGGSWKGGQRGGADAERLTGAVPTDGSAWAPD